MGEFMNNVVSNCYVLYRENEQRTFITIKPVIYLRHPSAMEIGWNEKVMIFDNVFDAKNYIKANINTDFDPIKVVGIKKAI